MKQRRAAIVCPVRTPVAIYGGALRNVPAEKIMATTIQAILDRTGLPGERIDEVIIAQSYGNAEAPCMGRYAALEANLPIEVSGYQVDRRCGSGLQAIVNAAMMVQTGAADVVLAGGVESMSNIEYYTTDMRWGKRAGSVTLHDRLQRGRERSQPEWRFGRISGMIETAENLVKEYGISRCDADEFAARSHKRAFEAWESGKFDAEIVPVTSVDRKGVEHVFRRDEGIRPETTAESLMKLNPLMRGGTVTAGNACQQNDAAAACLVVAEDKLSQLNLDPMGMFVGWASAGCDPAKMGIGPVPAVAKLFNRIGLGFDQMDLIEVNEAFACQVLAVLKGWGLDSGDERLNVNGSGISLGHPIGATGGRILATMLHELERRKGRYALETMCIGSGQGMAAVFERL
ncbi:acetyl-CoA C-acetyltransferase [Lacisediminimonas profundi]|uniref:acetyl-CoA C-acetyltransferase n=1 Tax=Lacisediminimonas profundi TaxID=2603856 RepID=UPI00124B5414|nr:acetyl-CoA C-acetyltransferase [Lacisediminimonas profundi]